MIPIASPYSYQPLTRETIEGGPRHYHCPQTGLPLPSVTTVLDHSADKAFLTEWKARVGEKEAERQSSYGKNLGTLVHENIENHIWGKERPRGSAPMRVLAREMSQRIIDNCLPLVDQVWGVETALYSPGISAGTCDLIGVYAGQPAIMDHKNAKKMRKRSDIPDYFTQMAAYAEMHDELFGTKIDQGVIFMVDRALNQETFVVEGLEFRRFKDIWWKKVEGYYEAQVAAASQ